MTTREPNNLPRGMDNWEEWRAAYEAHRADFVEMKIDRLRYRALLAMLGFSGDDLERELSEGFEARRAK